MIRKIPLHAKVMCVDGLAGESISVVIDPVGRNIAHLVVQDRTFPKPLEMLVPVEKAVESTSETIQLACTREELAKMQPFRREHYLEHESAEYGYAYSLPYMMAPSDMLYKPLEELNIQQENLALNRAADVEARDGYVGRVAELLLDPQTRKITYFTLMRGHLWGKKEVVLPLSLVDRADEETVYLTVDKKFIDELPSLPVNRPWKEVDATDLDLMAWSFKGKEQAETAFKALKNLEKNRQIELLNVAVITKDMDGKVSLREIKEIETRRGAISGAITGGLVGLLIGPVGAIIGATAGAATGNRAAKHVELGVSNEKLKTFQENMPPDSSAIVLLIEHRWFETVRQALAKFEHEFFHQRLTDVGMEETVQADE
jgi:uncharacterized membrane protein